MPFQENCRNGLKSRFLFGRIALQNNQNQPICFATSDLSYDGYNSVINSLGSLLSFKTIEKPQTWKKLEQLLLDSGHLIIEGDKKVFSLFNELNKETGTILIKPNMVRDATDLPNKSPEYIITNWSLVIPVLYYALLSVGKKGRVIIADAPNSDSNMDILKRRILIDKVLELCDSAGYSVFFIDLRKEQYFNSDGITTKRKPLPGDPKGYTIVDIGENSEFEDPTINYRLLRGACHDDADTRKHHSRGKHEYLLSSSVLQADLVINMPKFKSHSKIGVTGAIKNLVGINGDKNWLPHWRAGFIENGGDQYSCKSFSNIIKYFATSLSWPLLKYKIPARVFSYISKLAHRIGIKKIAGAGVGFQNDTTWRMVLDINKALLYANKDGLLSENNENCRSILHIMDAIIVGEGEGPLSVDPLNLGCIITSTDPVRVDILATKLCGLDWDRFSYLKHVTTSSKLRITNYSHSNAYVSLDNKIRHMDEVSALVQMKMPISWQNIPGNV